MNKLIGEHIHNIDKKRRVFIPSPFRVTRKWIVTAGLEECLFLFPETEWNRITENIASLPITRKDTRSFLRVLLSNARMLTCDGQGRILLPEKLVDYAGITRRCITVGMLNRIELWDTDRWQNFVQKSESRYSELAEKVTGLEF